MLQKKPTATKENPLKYTQMSLWLIKQGFSDNDLQQMTLARAAFLMKAAFPEESSKQNDGVRAATKADYRMLL